MPEHPTSDERWADLAAGRFPLEPPIDWAKVVPHPPRAEDTAQALYDAASRRLDSDPLFAARVTLARRVLEGVHHRTLDGQDVGWARMGAAVALLVAERPELITGEPPRRRPPAELLAWVVAPVVRYTGLSPADVAAHLLQALELDGYEVTVRADRFTSLRDDGQLLRIPIAGTCKCGAGIRRSLGWNDAEAILGPWRHVDPNIVHPPANVVAP